VANRIAVAIQRQSNAVEALQEVFRVVLVLDRLLAGEEVGELLIRAGKLADDIGRTRAFAAIIVFLVVAVLDLQSVLDDLVVEFVHAGERLGVEGVEAGKLAGGERLRLLVTGKRIVVDLAALFGARAGIDAEEGRTDG